MKNFKTKLFCLLVISTLIFPLFLFQSPYPIAEAAYGGDPDQWKYEMDDYAWQAGVSSYGTYIFTANYYNVYCFDTTDNSLVWQRSLSPSIIQMTPKVYEDILLVNIDPTIIGLNYTTGETIFTYTHSQDLDGGANKRGKPILVGNSLILRDYSAASGYGTIFVIDITDNSTIWSYNTVIDGFDFTRADSNIVYSNDVVYFCLKTYINGISNSGMVMARNATTGEHIWNTTTSEGYSYYADMWNDGTIDEEEGILYFSSTTTMYAFDITDGSIIWFFDDRTIARSSSIYIQPVIYGNDVFFSLGSIEMLFSANKLTGVSNWNFSLESEISSTPIISEDRIFVGSTSGLYFCLDSSTGEILWIFDGEYGAETESAIASGNVYFYDDYYLYGFDLVLGPKTFSLTVGENIEKVLFFDDFEDGISPYWYDIEEAALSDEAFEGEKGLFVSDWNGPYAYFTPIFDSTNKNFTLTYCNKVSTDTLDLEKSIYLEGSLFHNFEPYWYEDDTSIEFSIDFSLWNYFEHRYFYLGKIDGEWAVSEDSGDFLTSLNSDLIDNWMNYTFVFEVNEIDTNILVYLNSTFIGSVDVPVTSINFCGVSLSAPGYYDYISIIQNTYDAGTYLENVWNDELLVFRTTNPAFTGWLVNGELVSTDPIYTLDIEDDEITIEITTSEISNSVLQLPFDNETSTVAYDWSLRNNNGAITGASRTYDGYYGMSLAFDGNDYVTVIDDSTLDPTSAFMFSAQIKPTSFTDGTLIDKPSAYGVYTTSDGKIKVMINDDYFTTSASVLTLNQWNHVWVVYTGYDVAIYVNSIEKLSESYTETIYSSPYDLIIGYEFIGNIDEVQFYSGIYSDNPLLPIATYPYVYGGFIDTTACSWVVASLSYNFTGSYIRQDSTDPITYAEFNFTDGTDVIGLSYTASTGSYTTSGNDKVSFVSYNSIQSYNALLLYGRIRIESTIVSSQNIDLNLYCTTATSSDSLIIDNRFAIYGLGGVTSTTVVGDGALIAGGSVFDIMAQNSSLTEGGSSILVSTVAPNFQHLHTFTHLYQSAQWDEVNGVWDCPSFCSETGYLEFGVDYMEENCTWLNGWKTRIYIVDGGAGTGAWFAKDQSWVRLNVTWWNNNELIKYDDVYAFYEAYDENDTTTQISLYIDLWISEDEYSSNVAGHVSSQYYGMEEGGWWLWSNWQPVGSLQTSSTFYDNLYDGDGNLTSASTLKMFNVWSKIAKTGVGEGDTSCDEHLWASINEVVQIKQLPYNVELIGIASPIFMPTTTPDTPLGFFASIGNTLANALDSIYYAIATLAQGALTLTSSVLDSVFGLFGITGFTSSITSIIGGFATYFTQSITYVSSLIISIFTLFSSVVLFIIEWIGRVISTLIQIGDIVVGILNGTGAITTEIGNIWEWIKIDTWFSFIPIVMVIYWFNSIDQRAKQTGGGWMSILMGDINSIISVISFIFDFAWRVISTVIDLSMRFINVFI